MKDLIGCIIALTGICTGLYLSVYVMFWGGIIGIVNSVEPFQAQELTINILKLFFCELGLIPLVIGVGIGEYLID